MAQTDTLQISEQVRSSFDPILKAIGPVRQALASAREVVRIRPGYSLPAGQPVPAVVVALMPGTPPSVVHAAELSKKFGVPISVVEATPEEQIVAIREQEGAIAFGMGMPAMSAFERLLSLEEAAIEFAPPKSGNYVPLDPPALPLVDEPMKVTVCVSPEAGWSELERFLADTKERLTVAMYQFTAPHIFDAVQHAVTPASRTMELVLHPKPEPPSQSGVKAHEVPEQDVISQLNGAMANRFKMSWATLVSSKHPGGLWASAYHIKVAVRDGNAFWLSSGNWQSSNLPAVRLFGDNPDQLPPGFQRQYNRDYHAIIENSTLAAAYETYIKRDYDLTATAGEAQSFAMPDLFVPEAEPEEALEFGALPQLFPPLRVERRMKVQPLLTPDNYAENALALIQSAKTSVWFQNQYINFRNTGEDFPEFQALIQALKAKIADGLDVRIICRNMMQQESVDILLALGFPPKVMRFQPACHNKTIIVDRKVVMFGSHNWSNEGVSTNRDASLIFYDEEIADYLAQVYEYDWERLATAKPTSSQPHVAHGDEPAPPGYSRVTYAAVYED
jgi:hypothetical protein